MSLFYFVADEQTGSNGGGANTVSVNITIKNGKLWTVDLKLSYIHS